MNRLDPTASAALDEDVIKPIYFAFIDIVGDPVRANSSGHDVVVSGTGDPDLDGFTFVGISHRFTDISPVSAKRGGSGTVTARLSGIPGLDDDTLAQIGDRANWQGRTARLWRLVRNAANTQQGAIQHYYTGYCTALSIEAMPENQMIAIEIESYLVAFGQASNRTYLDQERYDPLDLSARAAIAIANGNTGNPVTSGTPVNNDAWASIGGPYYPSPY